MSWPADGLPRFKLVKTGSEFSILDRAFSHSTVAIYDGYVHAERLAREKCDELNAVTA